MLTAREASLKALANFRKNHIWSDSYFDNLLRGDIEPRDKALAARICYGVLQNMLYCDYYIAQYSSIALNKIEPLVADILRLSAYQILFLDKIPHNAIVDEAVKLTKSYSNARAAGFVNAVLRKLSSSAKNLPEIKAETHERLLSIKYSHPEPLVRLICEEYGTAEAEVFLAANNSIPPVTAQVNTLKTDTEALMKNLADAGVSASAHAFLTDAIELSTGQIENLDSFKNGEFYIQDAAARSAVIISGAKPGMTLIDTCAAPGGKSFAAAIQMHNEGKIFSFDISEKKLKLIKSGAKRLGLDILTVNSADARIQLSEHSSAADVVIADVPCSGIGVIRKKPDIRYKNISDFSGLPQIQLDILRNVSLYVKPGGILLYSTCTVLKSENEAVVLEFLKENSNFTLEAFNLPGDFGTAEEGMYTFLPHKHNTDGFFAAKLRRSGE